MNRYLLEIAYIGTRFLGIQKTINKLGEARLDTTTVQGCLELALRVFRPVNEIKTILSSRTDSGVHALHSTVHVDLKSKSCEPYNVVTVTGVLNRTLQKHNLPIRIVKTTIVPDTFHCRYSAVGRTYLYRLGVAKEGSECPINKNFENYLPIEELERCYFIQGIQKTINKLEEARLDTTTVQGCLELALRFFRPVNEIKTILSSRTDSGVHALHSTVHVDLQSYSGVPYNVERVTAVINRNLNNQSLPIRVIKTTIVPDTFHCRYSAVSRTYLYRLAVAKEGSECPKNKNFENYIPIDELERCYFIQDKKFDLERMKDAAQMFLGLHDFRTFMSVSRQKSETRDHPRFTVRTIDEITIKPGKSTAIEERAEELYNFFDIEIKAKSFLYKQVRRIVAALIGVANDRICRKDIFEMLTIPSKHSWDHRLLLAPPMGLYLKQVHYNEEDKKFVK